MARDQARYVKSALKSVPSFSFSTPAFQNSSSPTSTPTGTNSKLHLPERIASTCAEIAVLDDEKIVLAQNLIRLLSLAKARLDVDFVKVKTLQGEPIDDNKTPSRSFSQSSQLQPSVSLDKRSDAMSGINSIVQINQSLRNATVNTQAETFGPGYNKSKWPAVLDIPSIRKMKERRLCNDSC